MALLLTIICAGPGGYVAAIRAAQLGASVTLVENDSVGGVCLNRGCIPTKTLVSSAELLRHVRNAADLGITVSGTVSYDLAKVRERKDKVVATQVKGIRGLLKSWGVTLLEARGSLLSEDVVRVVQKDGKTMDLRSDRIIIATGSRPSSIPGIVSDGEQILTSDDAVKFKDVPASILIIGAGVIGSEFAFIYRAFGSEVIVADLLPRALSTEDQDISDIVEREFKKAKIKFLPGVKVETIVKSASGPMTVKLSNGQTLAVGKILVAVGRSMNTENLGFQDVPVATGRRGEIVVDDRMETSVPGIYAVGDVTGKMLLAHVASHQGMVAAENCMGGNAHMDYRVVPAGIFTMPEAASVGMREHEATAAAMTVKVGRFPYRALGKAHAMGAIEGIVKVIADGSSGKVLGVHLCGAHATDLIHEGALAVQLGATAKQVSELIHAHPTLAEGFMEAAGDVIGSAIHVPKPTK